MKINFKCTLFSSLFLFALLQTSCNKDDDNDSMQTDPPSGIFITNEGPFQNGSGTISFWDRTTEEVEQLYFERANNDQPVGNILQSMFVHDNRAYLVVNNANKVVVVDFTTFEMISEITDLALPRYFLTADKEKAYISQWGATGTDGSVQVVNLETNTVEKEIPTGSGAEAMLLDGNRLYVVNSGGFGRDSTIVIIDTNTDEVVNTVAVGDNPNSIVQDVNNDIWTISLGHTENFGDPNDPLNTKGKLVRLENDVVVESYDAPGGKNLVINGTGDQLYFTLNGYTGMIYHHPIGQGSLSTDPFYEGFFYRLGFDSISNNLLASDIKDFVSTGEVLIIDTNASLVQTIEAGIIPGGFWVTE